jgi:hypothetical protein
LSAFEHSQRHAILDATARVQELRLAVDILASQPQERRVANQIKDVIS